MSQHCPDVLVVVIKDDELLGVESTSENKSSSFSTTIREAQRVHDDAPFPRASAAAARPSPDLSSPATTTGSIPLSGGTPSNSTVSDTQAPKEEQNDATKKTPAKGHTMVGRVSRVGTMNKTVRVSRTVQVWDRHLQKYYKRKAHDMVHDPDNTLNEGDVVEYGGAETRRKPAPVVAGTQIEGTGTGTRKNVKYVVHQVITPFGLPVDVRPPRTVGSPKGRWEGTAGEVIKGNVRQRARGKSKAH
ncbi:hypothetical protein LTS17_010922 [Exophiala oligosperma]